MNHSLTLSFLLMCLALAGCQPAPPSSAPNAGGDKEPGNVTPASINGIPVNPLGEDGRVANWVLIGPFDQEEIPDAPEGDPSRTGFAQDYLGGEAGFELQNLEPLALASGEVTPAPYATLPTNRVNFDSAYNRKNMGVAYAYALIESPTEQVVTLGFGSDDSAKIWLNGELVLAEWTARRGTDEDATKMPVSLKKGLNRLLVKVEDAVLGWDFALNLYTKEVLAALKRQRELERVSLFEVAPVGQRKHVFNVGADFPEVDWRYPGLVEKHHGEMPLTVRWFGPELDEVKRPEEPGRYLMVAEAAHPNGLPVRRMLTFYAAPSGWGSWSENYGTGYDWQPSANGPFSPAFVQANREQVGTWLSGMLWDEIKGNPRGASLLAFIHERSAREEPGAKLSAADNPHLKQLDTQAALKRKLAGKEAGRAPLKEPWQWLDTRTPAARRHPLRAGTLKEAGFKPGLDKALEKICVEWASDPKRGPFSLLVARNGIVVFHGVFNSPGHPEQKLDSKFYVASVTKAVSGLLLARYIDQGLIGLDDPVGKYLPDFPTEGGHVLTVRHLMTHTSGLGGHVGYGLGGPFNAYLENVIAHQLKNGEVTPGTMFQYNGNGFNLAGRVIEAVSGKSVQRSFQEDLFAPLGIRGADLYAMGTSGMFSAEDIAKFGMLLAGKGTYGGKEYFSEATFEKLLPSPLEEHFPGLNPKPDLEWGIGLMWMNIGHDPGEGEYPYKHEKMLGHGSATASILQVGMESGVVIAGGRLMAGEEPERFVQEIVDTVHKYAIGNK